MRKRTLRFCQHLPMSLSSGLHDIAHNVRLWDRPLSVNVLTTFDNAMGSAQHPRQLLRTCPHARAMTLHTEAYEYRVYVLGHKQAHTSKSVQVLLPAGICRHCKPHHKKHLCCWKPASVTARCSSAPCGPCDCARRIAVAWAELLPTTGHKAARYPCGSQSAWIGNSQGGIHCQCCKWCWAASHRPFW